MWFSFFRPEKVVAAIDFGTTFSGAAFSTKAWFESNPFQVNHIQIGNQSGYYKTQTSVLLKEGEFVAFGDQAEKKFKNACLRGKRKDMFFFKTFKMQLHSEKVCYINSCKSYFLFTQRMLYQVI